jgi:CubicO group peptidase (beta-lactamase class C family)
MPMPDGTPMLGLQLSARDCARFGLVSLANGSWNGDDILLDKDYWKASISTSQPLNPAYGYLWWLNGKSGYRWPGANPPLNPGPLIPAAPQDLFAAMGASDNRIYVIPSRNLVVVRLGGLAGSKPELAISEFDSQFWTILTKSLPA